MEPVTSPPMPPALLSASWHRWAALLLFFVCCSEEGRWPAGTPVAPYNNCQCPVLVSSCFTCKGTGLHCSCFGVWWASQHLRPCPQQGMPSTNGAPLQLLHHQPWAGPISEGLSGVLCPLPSSSCCFHATQCVKSIAFCPWWPVPFSRASMGATHRLRTCAAPWCTSQARFMLQVSASDCRGHKSARNSSEGLGPYGVCEECPHNRRAQARVWRRRISKPEKGAKFSF